MGLAEKLLSIQTELKAPKNKENTFGKYKYRSCEDILEAVKPLLKKHNCLLTISDSIENIGERYYIKATTTIRDSENGETISNSALARETADKKGQDDSQITGTASSYARKYALNGLFLIDDTKDADTDEAHIEKEARSKGKKTEQKTDEQLNQEMISNVSPDLIPDPNRTPEYRAKKLREEIARTGVSEAKLLANTKVEKWEDVTDAQFVTLMGYLAKR